MRLGPPVDTKFFDKARLNKAELKVDIYAGLAAISRWETRASCHQFDNNSVHRYRSRKERVRNLIDKGAGKPELVHRNVPRAKLYELSSVGRPAASA